MAAAFTAAGAKIIEVEKEGRISWFIFEGLDECIALSKRYLFGDLSVNARLFKQALDQLKSVVNS